jgi:hypothetical protein
MIPKPMKDLLSQIKTDTETAIETTLRDRQVLSCFQSMRDLERLKRLTVQGVHGSIEADYMLDGEVIMMRRVQEGSVVYYGR